MFSKLKKNNPKMLKYNTSPTFFYCGSASFMIKYFSKKNCRSKKLLYSRSEATEGGHIRRLFLLKERSDGGCTISRFLEVCLSVRNIVAVTFRKMSYHSEFWKISNQIATFDLTELVGRLKAGDRMPQTLKQLRSIVLE